MRARFPPARPLRETGCETGKFCLLDAQAINIESALWAAIRALEDRGRLLDRMADQSQSRGMAPSMEPFRGRPQAAAEQARCVRDALGVAAELALSKAESDEADALAAAGGP